MKTIAISGASGFIGKELSQFFLSAGFTILKITRDDLEKEEELQKIIDKADIIFNLAGASILKRWSDSYKKEIYDSRILTTKKIVEAINCSKESTELLISSSALGIYDNDKHYDEYNAKYSNDFLSLVCQDWEKETNKAKCRVISYRFGIVLGKNGGAFQKLYNVFKLGLGGKVASGEQALSFIHLDDLKNAFYFAIENVSMHHAYNLCASIPSTNNHLTNLLAAQLKKPKFFTVPQFILEILFSEGAKVLVEGQSIYPKRLEEAGFKFEYNCIEDAIIDLCKKEGEKEK